MLGTIEILLDVVEVKTFTRKSGKTGQELCVNSGSKYPARIDCPDKEVLDLTSLKFGDRVTAVVELGFTSFQCVTDGGVKYYKRVPTFAVKNIV